MKGYKLQAASCKLQYLPELVLGCGNGFWVSGIRGGPEEGGDCESGWWLGLVTWNSRQLGAWSLEPGAWNLEPGTSSPATTPCQFAAVSGQKGGAGDPTRPWSQASSHGCLEAGSKKNTACLSAVLSLCCGVEYSVQIWILCRVTSCRGRLISRAGLHQES